MNFILNICCRLTSNLFIGLMKNLPLVVSLVALLLVIGHIVYREVAQAKEEIAILEEQPTSLLSLPTGFIAKPYRIPSEMSFANEPVPLHLSDVRERLDRELQINSYLHSSTLFILKRANRWLPQIEIILKENNIPDDFKYLPLIESALLNAVSPKEAAGFWQIIASAGKMYDLEITKEVDQRYDPLLSTHAACKYLNDAHAKFGSWTLAAASYNRGMSGLQKALDNQKVNSYYDLFLNDETSRYLFRMLAMKEILEHPSTYGFQLANEELYQPEPVRYVIVKETIKSLVDFSQKEGTNYKTLKRLNPWLREEELTVKRGKSYRIALPA
jgi:membrane-bound lytic murein transglycosylase D